MATPLSRLVALGSTLAALGTAHGAWNVRQLRRPRIELSRPVRAGVSVLIPARDEAATIGACVTAAVRQGASEVLVLDDGSHDDTAALARTAGGRVITGTAPPPGALGKPHACAQLAAAADPDSDVLVFVDADVRLHDGAVAAAVRELDASGLDLVSPHPRQLAATTAERLVQPLLQWSWLTTLPLAAAERSPRPALAAANGQFLVVRRAAYERAGGHAAAGVRDSPIEDIALLRAIKRTGGRGVMIDGTELAVTRMYDGWPALRDGYGKSLWAAFGSEPGAVAVAALLTLAYVVPPLAAARGSRVGLAGYGAGVAGRVVTARATGARVWPDALAHPVSVGLLDVLIVRSLVQRRRGGLTWKGRSVAS